MKANKHLNSEQLILKIIKMAKEDYNYKYFSQIEYRNYNFPLQTLINEFKSKYVYPSSTYKKSKGLYTKDRLSLSEFKGASNAIMKEIVSKFKNDSINTFFNISHNFKSS